MYVKHGKVSATIPKEREIDSVTLEDALEWIAARKARSPQRRRRPARRATKKKAAKKKAAKKEGRERKPQRKKLLKKKTAEDAAE